MQRGVLSHVLRKPASAATVVIVAHSEKVVLVRKNNVARNPMPMMMGTWLLLLR
jgi:hypothetical protein